MTLTYFEIRYGDLANLPIVIDSETQEIFVTQPCLERLLGWELDTGRKKIASKSLKVALGEGYTVGKSSIKSVKVKDTLGRPNNCKSIPFHFALKIIAWQVKEGNDAAFSLMMAGFADSFTSLALEQAGYQVKTGDRHELISYYKRLYHRLMDWVRDQHIEVYGCPPDWKYYAKVNSTVDRHLCGKFNFDSDRVNNCSEDEMAVIKDFQGHFIRFKAKRFKGVDPYQAVLTVLNDDWS